MTAMISPIEILANRVACRNELNAQAETLRKELETVFSEFFGKKIVKFTPYKSLGASVKKKLEYIESAFNNSKFSFYFEIGFSSVYCCLKSTYKTSDVSVGYEKCEFFVAAFDRDTGVMTNEFRDVFARRTDYTVEEILTVRQKIKELEGEINALKSSIYEFSPS